MFVCAQKKCFIHFWQSEKGTTLRCFKALLKQWWAFRNGGSSFRCRSLRLETIIKINWVEKKTTTVEQGFWRGRFFFIFIDLMVQTIKFYIGQRGFYLTSAGPCHKSCAAGTEAERVTSPFDWVSSANCAVSWCTLIRHGSLNWSRFREVREAKGHRDETRWRLCWDTCAVGEMQEVSRRSLKKKKKKTSGGPSGSARSFLLA